MLLYCSTRLLTTACPLESVGTVPLAPLAVYSSTRSIGDGAVIVLRTGHVQLLITRRTGRVEIGAESERFQTFVAGELAVAEVHDLGRDARVHVVTENATHVVDGAEAAAGARGRGDARGVIDDVRRIAGGLGHVSRLGQARGDAFDSVILREDAGGQNYNHDGAHKAKNVAANCKT